MHQSSRSFLPLLIIFIIILSGCNSLPAPIARLLASETPTPLPTSTPTSLPVYHTFTPTPLPAIQLSSCAFPEDCPDVLNAWAFVEADVESGGVYTIDVPYDQPIVFRASWISLDDETLEANMNFMRFFFEVDGQSYLKHDYITKGFKVDLEDPSLMYPMVSMGYLTEDWQVGEDHTVYYGFEFVRDVFDGWEAYPAGTIYEYTYIVNPVELPTATPTSTATSTPVPTRTPTPRPTQPPATPTEACSLDTQVNIINDTGGWITIYLTGPAKYTFEIPDGEKMLNMCGGSYSYTAYGCGGASINGTAGDGDEIEFWCE